MDFPWDTKYSLKTKQRLLNGKYQAEHDRVRVKVSDKAEFKLNDNLITGRKLAEHFNTNKDTILSYKKAKIILPIKIYRRGFVYDKIQTIELLKPYCVFGALPAFSRRLNLV